MGNLKVAPPAPFGGADQSEAVTATSLPLGLRRNCDPTGPPSSCWKDMRSLKVSPRAPFGGTEQSVTDPTLLGCSLTEKSCVMSREEEEEEEESLVGGKSS